MLRYSFDMDEDADLIETAVKNVLASGIRTGDIMGLNTARVPCSTMGETLVRELISCRRKRSSMLSGRGCFCVE